MIKKYSEYIKEGLNNFLTGPTEEEIIKNFKNDIPKLLKISIENNYINGIKYAIEHNTPIHVLDLYNIIKIGNVDLIKTMLEYNIPFYPDCVQDMLNLGIKISYIIKYKPTLVLLYASQINDKKLLIYAIQHGADVSTNDNIIIFTASKRNQFEIVKFLIEYGASVKTHNFFIMNRIIQHAPVNIIDFVLEKFKFTYDEYKIMFNNAQYNIEREKIFDLINKHINKNVDYDISKPWKPYKGVYGKEDRFTKQWYDDNKKTIDE